jgi:DNA-binding winged helix-turn-helix (wHTH) protein
MSAPAEKSRVVHFGLFEVDLQEAELRKSGIRIKLQEQPFQILAMLLERPGQTVTREELRTKLWPADTFVDFDHSLNSSINKLREALGDTSENPRFIETLHRRGYRFTAPVDAPQPRFVEAPESVSVPATTEAATPPVSTTVTIARPRQRRWGVIAGAVAAAIAFGGAGFGVYSFLHRPAPRPFQNFTVTQITNSGMVKSAAISPDGRYVASVLDYKGMQSLWLRNLPTGSDTQIIPASTAEYDRLQFSPDGNYIYFRMGKNPNFDGYNLFRCPVLGGAPQEVVRNIYSFAFSPDGPRIAYHRENDPEALKYQILTSSLDGNNETVWQTGSTVKHPLDVAWSPKGDAIYAE